MREIDAVWRWVQTTPYRRLLWFAGALAVLAIAGILAATRTRANISYTTVPVLSQTLAQSVTASGTVNPQNSISVGTQASGTIAAIFVDFNSKVTKGEVLARLDPSTFQAQLAQAQASLAQAQAQAQAAASNATGGLSSITIARDNNVAERAAVASAQANIAKATSTLQLAQAQETRDASLFAQGYLARTQMDTDRSTVAQDQAAVVAAQSAAAQAHAQAQAGGAGVSLTSATAQAQGASAQAAQATVQLESAIVDEDKLNLSHTVITSPVTGTVVARDVSVGQTVAASFSTPTLFTIAQNLAKMEVDINVGETDIGSVKAADPVAFTVLAYPTRVFHGTVAQVRINPQTLANVVTYAVVVDVNNPDGALLPGMTANATIQTASVPHALVVPLAALGWNPSGRSASGASPWGKVAGGSASGPVNPGAHATLFVLRNGAPKRVNVTVSLATSTQAAVVPMLTDGLKAGDPVIVGSTGAVRTSKHGPIVRSPVAGALRGLR
ncbi:MAG: efflux RND transporter periplasmic adaptor subunit [Vulcanimicrobiaceae bacterium]